MRTFSEALPADSARLIRNVNRRLRYQMNLDRPKVWADSPNSISPFVRGLRDQDEIQSHLEGLRSSDVATYVRSWCHLNHLKSDEAAREETRNNPCHI